MRKLFTILIFCCFPVVLFAQPQNTHKAIQQFIDQTAAHYSLNKKKLTELLNQAHYDKSIIKKITRPYESKPWYIYRKHFLTHKRIAGGVKFWRKHQKALQQAQKRYGVPPSVIIAILGVETNYGQYLGKYRTLDALYTLAFYYPHRSDFFKEELAQFFLMCKEAHLDPLKVKGSYAGAIGMPQFMPSSYRHYAVDASQNAKIDLANNSQDAIASIANYLKHAGWEKGRSVAIRARIRSGKALPSATDDKLIPHMTIQQYIKVGIQPTITLPLKDHAVFFYLQGKHGKKYWLGLHNFTAITHYNPRINYAMAVYELSQAIKKAKQQHT